MTELNTFNPDWASPPGDSVLDAIEERGWTQADLAQRLGYSTKHVNQLIRAKVPLSDDAAIRLERVLGNSAKFWLTREAQYREQVAKLAAAEITRTWHSWLDELPLSALKKIGAIAKLRNTPQSKNGLVEECLKFFGVASPDEWRSRYSEMQVSFRRTNSQQTDVGSIAAWLRLGEQTAESQVVARFDTVKFTAVLAEIRALTVQPPSAFEPLLRQKLSQCGVYFALVPLIPGARVSGVARWLGKNPLIQLSLYGKSNDKFWFTFFHEAAHVLLHAENKSAVYLDELEGSDLYSKEESEANQWAANTLIPEIYLSQLRSLGQSTPAIQRFAESLGIHAGIVVGRMQHEKLLSFAMHNELKAKFEIVRSSTAKPSLE